MRRIVFIAFVSVVVAILFFWFFIVEYLGESPSATSAALDSCDSLVAFPDQEDDQKEYLQFLRDKILVLKEDPNDLCAQAVLRQASTGFTEASEEDCSRVQKKAEDDDQGPADIAAEYAALLADDQNSICAQDGLLEQLKEMTITGENSICEDSDSLQKYVRLAQDNYLTEKCVEQGLKESIKELSADCKDAEELKEQLLYEEAIMTYAEQYETAQLEQEDRVLLCAVNGIADTLDAWRGNDQSFQGVRSLLSIGWIKEAQDKFKAVVEDDANANLRIPPDLWIVAVLLRFLAVFFWVFVTLVLVFYIIWPYFQQYKDYQLDIGDFSKGSSQQDIGTGMAAMIEDTINQLTNQGETKRTHMITEPSDGLVLPAAITTPIPKAGIIAALINMFIPQKIIALSGALQKSGSRGAGLTVQLARKKGNQLIATTTLWQDTYHPDLAKENDPQVKDYLLLAEMAAIWAIYQLGNKLTDAAYKQKEPQKKPYKVFGTSKWKSLAFLKAGAAWQLTDNKDKARITYVNALTEDTSNYGALMNLGRMDVEELQYKQGITRLVWAYEQSLKDGPTKLEPAKLARYKVKYNISAAYFNLYKSLKQAEKAKNQLSERTEPKKKRELDEKIDRLKECPIFPLVSQEIWEGCQDARLKVRELRELVKEDDWSTEFKKLQKNQENMLNELVEPMSKTKSTSYKDGIDELFTKLDCCINNLKEGTNNSNNKNKITKALSAIQSSHNTLKEKWTQFYQEVIDNNFLFVARFVAESLITELENEEARLDKGIKSETALADRLMSNREWVRWAKRLTKIMLGGMVDEDVAKAEEDLDRYDTYEQSQSLSYKDHYNLSCGWSELGEKEDDIVKRREFYDSSLAHLSYAVERGGGIKNWARKDPSLSGVRESATHKQAFSQLIPVETPSKLAIDIEKQLILTSLTSLRANDSCTIIVVTKQSCADSNETKHISNRHDKITFLAAFDAKDEALDPPYDKATKVQFKATIDAAKSLAAHVIDANSIHIVPPTKPPVPTALTKMKDIDEKDADKLREEAKVDSVEVLFEAGATRVGRQKLAARTGLDKGLVYKWVKMADLMRIDGITDEYAQQLHDKGKVETVKELRGRNAKNLLASLASTTLTEKIIQSWIGEANRLPIILEIE